MRGLYLFLIILVLRVSGAMFVPLSYCGSHPYGKFADQADARAHGPKVVCEELVRMMRAVDIIVVSCFQAV